MWLKWIKTGDCFDEPPVLAISHKNGRKIVHAVGRAARASESIAGVTLRYPFDSFEPLLMQFDEAVALMQHGIREIFSARMMLSPKLVLKVVERQSPLSALERNLVQKFAARCGVARLYLFLDEDHVPDPSEFSHSRLKKAAHFTTEFVS